MEYVKGFMRDPVSHVLINNDQKQYNEHKWKMDMSIKMKNLQNEVDMLKQIVAQLQTRLEEKI